MPMDVAPLYVYVVADVAVVMAASGTAPLLPLQPQVWVCMWCVCGAWGEA